MVYNEKWSQVLEINCKGNKIYLKLKRKLYVMYPKFGQNSLQFYLNSELRECDEPA